MKTPKLTMSTLKIQISFNMENFVLETVYVCVCVFILFPSDSFIAKSCLNLICKNTFFVRTPIVSKVFA